MRVERLDRILLVLLALLVTALAVLGWLVLAGLVTVPAPADVVDVAALDLPGWWVVPVVVGCLLVAALGVWLVWKQLPMPRHLGVDDLEVVTRSTNGSTTVSPAAVAHLLERHVAAVDGVEHAKVTVRPTDDGHGRLWIQPRLAADADVGAATRGVRDVVDQVAHTLAVPLEIESIRVSLARRPEGRVV